MPAEASLLTEITYNNTLGSDGKPILFNQRESNQNSKVLLKNSLFDTMGNTRYYLTRYELIVDISPKLRLYFSCWFSSSHVGPHRASLVISWGGGRPDTLISPAMALLQSSHSQSHLFIFISQKGMCSLISPQFSVQVLISHSHPYLSPCLLHRWQLLLSPHISVLLSQYSQLTESCYGCWSLSHNQILL